MTTKNKFYLTTAIPYTNSLPHLGHALEFLQADVIARYHRLRGDETALLTGADENALKIVQAAEKEGIAPQQLTDRNTEKFKELARTFNVGYDFFQRGTDKKLHYPGTEKLWQLCQGSGDIYKKNYRGLYCVGCETFYTPDELTDGKCREHLKKPEVVEEENYFFRLSRYQKQLQVLIESDRLQIIPRTRKNEALSFIKRGLNDLSISRSNQRARNWGIPVSGDPTQRIYTWFDGLNIYQTGVGFGFNDRLYKKWWPADLHIIGKGIIIFHAIYWPAILMSAGLSLPKTILAHGYITTEGQKMSKSLGNVVNPFALVKKYGVDPVRYYLLREIPTFSDGDYSEKRFKEVYNADLANGLGNLFSRTTAVARRYFAGRVPSVSISPNRESGSELFSKLKETKEKYQQSMNNLKLNQTIGFVWQFISECDRYIDKEEPWKLGKRGQLDKLGQVLYHLLEAIHQISWLIYPFLPQTAKEIGRRLGIERLTVSQPSQVLIKTGEKIISRPPLFPRL